jgi:hypothetical protein
MNRLKSIPVAIAAVALSAGAALGYAALPAASTPGLETASEAAGHVVPARPAEHGPTTDIAPAVEPADAAVPPEDTHGFDVSTIAKADDLTPETNHGADVSAVAKDNHGQETAASRDAGKPDGAGKPDSAGKPDGAGRPDEPGQP